MPMQPRPMTPTSGPWLPSVVVRMLPILPVRPGLWVTNAGALAFTVDAGPGKWTPAGHRLPVRPAPGEGSHGPHTSVHPPVPPWRPRRPVPDLPPDRRRRPGRDPALPRPPAARAHLRGSVRLVRAIPGLRGGGRPGRGGPHRRRAGQPGPPGTAGGPEGAQLGQRLPTAAAGPAPGAVDAGAAPGVHDPPSAAHSRRAGPALPLATAYQPDATSAGQRAWGPADQHIDRCPARPGVPRPAP